MTVWRVLVVLAGCGRIGFDRQPGAGPGDDGGVPLIDGPDASFAMGGTYTFGELQGVTFSGVTTDTYLDSSNVTAVHGGNTTALCDTSPARVVLLRFELAAVPSIEQVTAVELEIQTLNNAASTTNDVYAILEDWDEAAASWSWRAANTPWLAAGAAPPSRAVASLATFAANMKNKRFVIALNATGIQTVQQWISDPTSNRGFALVAGGGGWDMAASEGPTAVARPLLRVVLAAPTD